MILKLVEVVNGQYREIERSLLSLGDFYLSDRHTNFQRPIWSATELTQERTTYHTTQGVTLTFCITRPAGLVTIVYH